MQRGLAEIYSYVLESEVQIGKVDHGYVLIIVNNLIIVIHLTFLTYFLR